MGVITGTLTSSVDGYTVAYYTASDGLALVGPMIALLVVFLLFLVVQSFQLWALTLCMILVLAYLPFSLTPAAPYVAIMIVMVLVIAQSLHTFTKVVKR